MAAPGETRLHYRIERKLGEGGMGEVWLAEDTKLGRPVALKFLSTRAALGAEARERLVREARTASSLSHPGILTIYAVETDGDGTFIAMEFADGETLNQWSKDREVPLAEVLQLAISIGEGLAAAHDKGVVHRDIKPSNVMISKAGRAQIMDFGLAKIESEPQLTETGSTLGTLAYMSPEQVKGQTIDARTDVFSFGAMLYELACGRSPFQRDGGPAAVLHAILEEDPAPASRVRQGLPRSLDAVLSRALHKDRNRRYADMPSLLEDLRAVSDGRALDTQGPAKRGWVVAAALIVAAIGMGAWAYRSQDTTSSVEGDPQQKALLANRLSENEARIPRSSDERSTSEPAGETLAAPASTEIPTYAQRLLSILSGSPHSGTLNSDATLLAFVKRVGGTEQLFVVGMVEGAPQQLTSGEQDVERPRWQPGGNKILFQHASEDELWNDGNIYVVSALGGETRLLFEKAQQASWSADGETIVFERERELWMAAADGRDAHRLEGFPSTYNPVVGSMPALSPDGKRIVFFAAEVGPIGKLFTANLDGSDMRPISDEPEMARDPSFSPDGNWVIYSSQREGPRLLSRAWAGPGAPLRPQQVTSGTGNDSEPCVSADGRRVLFTDARKEYIIQVWSPDEPDSKRVLHSSRGALLFPTWSPTGERIAAFGDGRRGGSQLFVMQPDGSGLQQVTDDPESTEIFPRWSADGRHLYYYHQPADGNSSLRRIPATGGAVQSVVQGWGMQTHPYPALSADGRSLLAFELRDGRFPAGLTLDLETGESTPLTEPLFRPAYSETGDWIAGEWPPGTVVIQEVATGRRTSLGPGQVPRMAPGDQDLYFIVDAGEGWDLWSMNRDGSGRQKRVELGGAYEQSPWIDVNRFGEVIWAEYRSSTSELWVLEQE